MYTVPADHLLKTLDEWRALASRPEQRDAGN